MYLVHCTCRICNSSDFIRIKFFPPVKRGGYINGDKYLTNEFSVVTAGIAEPLCKVKVVFTEGKNAAVIDIAVALCPAVHRVSCAADCIFKVHYVRSLQFYHIISPL